METRDVNKQKARFNDEKDGSRQSQESVPAELADEDLEKVSGGGAAGEPLPKQRPAWIPEWMRTQLGNR